MVIQKKICLIGSFNVGKSSLIRRYVDGIFSERYISTIGVNISRRQCVVDRSAGPVDLNLLIWDTAGDKEATLLAQRYYRGSSGAIIVCDLTREETLANLTGHIRDFWAICPQVPIVIVGNKVDLVDERSVSYEQLATIAAQYQAPWFLTSAKTGEQVETIFQALAEKMMINVPESKQTPDSNQETYVATSLATPRTALATS